MLLLLLSSARAMARANHSLQSFSVKEELFGKLIVSHANMDSKTFFKCYPKRLL